MIRTLLLVAVLGLLAAPLAPAADICQAGLSVHIVPGYPGDCNVVIPPPTAHQITAFPNGDCSGGNRFTVYLFVCNVPDSIGVAGVEFGIDYEAADYAGVDVNAFTRCSDLAFTETGWPAADTGALLTWDPNANCQGTPLDDPTYYPPSSQAVAGYFDVFVYSPDYLYLTPRPTSGRLSIAGCIGGECDVSGRTPSWWHPSRAGFCFYGSNTCLLEPDPVETTTWSRLKRQFDP